MKPAVFFDRDGVLNRPVVRHGRAYAPLSVEDFDILPEAPDALAKIRQAGFLTVVVTNQPEIARGQLSWTTLLKMHERLKAELQIDGIYVCPHDPSDGCCCHKPAPGLLEQAASDWNLDLSASFLIGDRWRDIGAGRAAGCYSILIERDYSGPSEPHYRAQDLLEAVDHILGSWASGTIQVQKQHES
jgi:D-glycero-D-manno-heptose 1,7-bisphosphate phosphatase